MVKLPEGHKVDNTVELAHYKEVLLWVHGHSCYRLTARQFLQNAKIREMLIYHLGDTEVVDEVEHDCDLVGYGVVVGHVLLRL